MSCVEEERLNFQEGDLVTFSEVRGMGGINGAAPVRVKAVKPYMLELEFDCSTYGMYTTGARKCQDGDPCWSGPGAVLASMIGAQ